MSWLSRTVGLAAYLAGTLAAASAHAGAKDENAAEWLAPKWLNDVYASLAAKGLTFGAIYIDDNITNVTGGSKRGAIHFGRFDLSVDADLEKLVGWRGENSTATCFISMAVDCRATMCTNAVKPRRPAGVTNL